MKIIKKQREILEKHFGIYEDKDYYELEEWTNRGVDMIITLYKESDKDLITQLEDYVENFEENMDEEIDLHRESKDYREAFTIRQSLEDFEDWVEYVNGVIEELKEGK